MRCVLAADIVQPIAPVWESEGYGDRTAKHRRCHFRGRQKIDVGAHYGRGMTSRGRHRWCPCTCAVVQLDQSSPILRSGFPSARNESRLLSNYSGTSCGSRPQVQCTITPFSCRYRKIKVTQGRSSALRNNNAALSLHLFPSRPSSIRRCEADNRVSISGGY